MQENRIEQFKRFHEDRIEEFEKFHEESIEREHAFYEERRDAWRRYADEEWWNGFKTGAMLGVGVLAGHIISWLF